jgi:hypothetical protein
LPHLQALYAKIKDRKDIQIISLNVDDNVGVLTPFVSEKKLTFPVISASRLVEDLVPTLAIPLNWIVDATGVVRFESVGFGGDGEKWVDQLMQTIEKVRADAKTGGETR